MKRIIVTGFAPFGGESVNPSYEAVGALPEQIDGAQLIKMELPVVFGRAAQILLQKIEEIKPDAVVSVGLAGSRDAVTPELIAVNYMAARIPDNDGNSPQHERIAPDGPDGIFSRLPVREMVENMAAAGISAKLSYSAGAYVCNDLFYRVLYGTQDSRLPFGFIHVPNETEQVKDRPELPALPLAELTAALTVCLRTLLVEIR